ncbi:MAG: folylpolyglutamate synthase/dihydrofolate synthase family protein [Actinomycetota bacterium]
MRFEEALAELDGRRESRMVPDLARILQLATLLDDPQLSYPTIHVTGTNGKSTTARIATELACAHGITTGLYTSPHLETVTERFSVCGVDMTRSEFAAEYEHLLPFLLLVDAGSDEQVTYFEALTALAYLWLADKPVGLGVFEVGMGGTWDATNLVAGDVAVICPVGLDHPELGATVEEVAGEKAGIIKEGKIAIVREQPPEAARVIEDRATAVGAELRREFADFELDHRLLAVGGQAIVVRGLYDSYDDLFLPLFGEHAARNAAAAVASVEALIGQALDHDAVRRALAGVTSPGRLEVVGRSPLVILDGAHNPAGTEALAVAMREFFTWERLHLVVAVSANKDVEGMLQELAPLADTAYATTNRSDRAGATQRVADELEAHGKPVAVFGSVADALEAARDAAGRGDCILVTGSLYTVAEARRALAAPAERPSGDR